MSARTELDQLAAARPGLLDHTERLVDTDQEDRILRQILLTARPAGAPSGGRSPARVGAGRTRSPRLVIGLVTGAVATAIAATGVLAASGGFRAGTATPRRTSTAGTARAISIETVAKRAIAATAAASSNDVEITTTLYPSQTAGVAAKSMSWQYGVTVRTKYTDTQGALWEDESTIALNGNIVRRFVSYATRSYTGDSYPAARYSAPPGIARYIGRLLTPYPGNTGPATKVVTRVTVDHRAYWKVTVTWPGPSSEFTGQYGNVPLGLFTPADPALSFPAGEVTDVNTIWIDAATYLPVREDERISGQVLQSTTYDFHVLGQADRSELVAAPIPAGFTCTQPRAGGPSTGFAVPSC